MNKIHKRMILHLMMKLYGQKKLHLGMDTMQILRIMIQGLEIVIVIGMSSLSYFRMFISQLPILTNIF